MVTVSARPILGPRSFSAAARALGATLAVLAALLQTSTPSLVSTAAAAGAPADCVLPDDGSMGRLDWDAFRRPIGTVRAVMLFVDFPDVPATRAVDGIVEDLSLANASGWLARARNGKVSLAIEPLRQWLRDARAAQRLQAGQRRAHRRRRAALRRPGGRPRGSRGRLLGGRHRLRRPEPRGDGVRAVERARLRARRGVPRRRARPAGERHVRDGGVRTRLSNAGPRDEPHVRALRLLQRVRAADRQVRGRVEPDGRQHSRGRPLRLGQVADGLAGGCAGPVHHGADPGRLRPVAARDTGRGQGGDPADRTALGGGRGVPHPAGSGRGHLLDRRPDLQGEQRPRGRRRPDPRLGRAAAVRLGQTDLWRRTGRCRVRAGRPLDRLHLGPRDRRHVRGPRRADPRHSHEVVRAARDVRAVDHRKRGPERRWRRHRDRRARRGGRVRAVHRRPIDVAPGIPGRRVVDDSHGEHGRRRRLDPHVDCRRPGRPIGCGRRSASRPPTTARSR